VEGRAGHQQRRRPGDGQIANLRSHFGEMGITGAAAGIGTAGCVIQESDFVIKVESWTPT
jgi:hypothetical protein